MADTDTAVATEPAKLIAPLWHTVALVVFLLGLSALGAYSHALSPGGAARHGHTRGYLLTIAIEWFMALFAWYGLRLRGVRLGEIMGVDAGKLRGFFPDLGIAIVFLIGSNVILGVLTVVLRATNNDAVRRLAPSGRQEQLLYVLLALSAGICEEIVCRGYFQKQFAALTRSVPIGLIIQGIIFGAAHGYQGWKRMLIIAVYGCMFGWLAAWRRSLRPGMMTHALQDAIVGLLARHFIH